jgi:hypothetical protein
MSGFLPANTSLQLGDNSGNIFHLGILSTNTNNTPNLPLSFPSSSTGNSLAHAHYTEPTSNALKFLNASGTGDGGHQFWNSSSSSAPIKYFDVNKDRALFYSTIRNPTNNVVLDLCQNTLTINNTNNQQTLVSSNTISARNNATATGTSLQPDIILAGNDINGTSSAMTSTFISVYDAPNSNTARLYSNDLTFNSVSLPSTVSKNTLDISQNTTDISKNKVDISNNTNNINTLTIKQTNLIYQFSSPAIYADGQPPSATPTSIINSYAINAWYFKNTVSGYKINWYMPTTSGLKVQDILGLYLRLFNVSTTSNDNTLFLTVYTVPDAGPNYSWYKSKMTYVITATPTINTLYTFFANPSGNCPNPSSYATTLLPMTPSTVQNPRGTYGPTETIMFFAIGSNSASAVNSVEVVVQKFGVMTPSGTQEFQFAPLL